MAQATVPRGVANLVSFILFLIVGGALAYYDQWWPALIIAFGLGLALRNVLIRKLFEAIADLVVFVPLFIFQRYSVGSDILVSLPFIFLICGLYIMAREFYDGFKMLAKKKDTEDPPKKP